jgi:hypothetical protein
VAVPLTCELRGNVKGTERADCSTRDDSNYTLRLISVVIVVILKISQRTNVTQYGTPRRVRIGPYLKFVHHHCNNHAVRNFQGSAYDGA